MAEMDQMPSDIGKLSVRTYIDTFMARQGKLLDAARRSQKANENNLKKRYANCQRLPQLRHIPKGVSRAKNTNIQWMSRHP